MLRSGAERTVDRMKHSKPMMWCCVGLLVLAVALAVAGVNVAYAALFALPCVLMMGAMMWMMRAMGGGSGGSSLGG